MSDWTSKPCAVVDDSKCDDARTRQSQLTKPPGSLGRLEAAAVQLAGLQGRDRPRVDRVWISIFAGDHGVAAEGVSAFPQVVTGEMIRNFATGGAAISVLARELGAELEVVNLGTVNDPGQIAGVRRALIAPQTANFCEQAAMSEAQLVAAMQAGADSVAAAVVAGTDLFIGGEMGIANTTAASALGCALLGVDAASLSGAGTGLDASGISHKAEVIARALAVHGHSSDARDTLRRLGGFEIAALVGAYIAAAQAGLPVMVDGFITTVAALTAVRIQPASRAWMLFGHRSQEQGHACVLDALDAEPLLDLGLRLGEGSGAASAVPLLRLACALHNTMATFAEAGVSET